MQLSPGSRSLLQVSRIGLNVKAGKLTSTQASQFYSQVSANQKQITADKAANGGTLSAADAKTIQQSETQTGQQIYTAAHNGATPPTIGPTTSAAELRNLSQFARVGLDEKAGNLTSTQASGLYSQIHTTQQQVIADQLANNGTLTQAQATAFDQTQSLLSTQINADSNTSSAS